MPLQQEEGLPKGFPTPEYLTLENWKRGVIDIINESRLPKNALKEADNAILVEDGQPSVRYGVDWYGTAVPNGQPLDGGDYFDFNGSIHIVVVAGGVVYRSTDDAQTWEECTGATLTAGEYASMNQYNSYLHITTGADDIVRYDGTTTLQSYAALTTPSAPTVTETGSGLTAGTSYRYYYKIARVNEIGYSAPSAASTVIETGLARVDWSAGTNYATLAIPAYDATQIRTDIYVSEDDLYYYYLGSTSTTTFVDDGTFIPNPAIIPPTGDTSAGPHVEELSNVGSRMYGVRDRDNRYRIWFSSGSTPKGAFSGSFDGGYLDWQEGGKLIPMHVEDYRDGKGTPLATIWCDSADGQGGIVQMSLETLTIGDISITIPSAYKLPGSRGTPAPRSVVNVLNNYMYYNSQAMYDFGSRQQLLNLLSTDEASANIRRSVKQISQARERYICSVYFDAKVLFSISYDGETNNAVIMYDTERKAWLPRAFTIGFKRFFRYADATRAQKLLAFKDGDTRLSEISESIQGDYGEPFRVSIITGLYPVTRNRFEFQFTEQAEFELSNPWDSVNIELLGIERSRGYITAKTRTYTAETVNAGWDVFAWDVSIWDNTSSVPTVYSESSIKRYFPVQRELNAIQWRITTNTLAARFVLRTLQTWGTRTEGGPPRPWKI